MFYKVFLNWYSDYRSILTFTRRIMKHIAIISSSVRDGRLSHRVALFLEQFIPANYPLTVEVLDLKEYNFPLFNERFAFQKSPSSELVDFTERFKKADGLVIVSPVYNADFPAALKNVIDLYYKEWVHKPVGVVSVTSGMTPGIATVQRVQTLLLKLGALVAPVVYTVVNTAKEFEESGIPVNKEQSEKLAKPMINELIGLIGKDEERPS